MHISDNLVSYNFKPPTHIGPTVQCKARFLTFPQNIRGKKSFINFIKT